MVFISQGPNLAHIIRRQAGTAAPVVGVLQADEPGTGKVVVVGANGCFHLRQIQRAIGLVGDLPGVNATHCRHAARFEKKQMSVIADDDLLAAPAVGQHRDQISHSATGDIQCSFLADTLGRHSLQAVDSGILTHHVVANFGSSHCLSHGRGG